MTPSTPADIASAATPNQAAQNIGALMEYYAHEERKLSPSQQFIEGLGNFIGQPRFPFLVIAFVFVWVSANAALRLAGRAALDPPPYFYLQGLLCLGALLIATIVLSKQNRMANLAEQRAHLDLRITLLTEQKAAKLIDLIEELRRDLPNVLDRHDPEASELGHSMNPEAVRAVLDEHKESSAPARV